MTRKAHLGIDDFKTLYPDLAAEWSAENQLRPDSYLPSSHYSAHWMCDKGHQYKNSIRNRVNRNQGCPYCVGNKVIEGENDLKTLFPEIANQWHPTKNLLLETNQVSARSINKAWWQDEHGHEWSTSIRNRTILKSNCPFCGNYTTLAGFNDVATINPELSQEWHPTKNKNLMPAMLTPGTTKRVWWQDEHGHEWEASVYSRTTLKTGCPICANKKVLVGFNDLKTLRPEIALEWDYDSNGSLLPTGFTIGSKKLVSWCCSKDKNHKWITAICDRTRMNAPSGCPHCYLAKQSSVGEEEIALYIKSILPGMEIQQNIKGLLPLTSRQEIDIIIPSKNIAVEYNGIYWHSELSGRSNTYHQEKFKAAKEIGYQLIQIWEDDWRFRQDIVKALLAHKLGVAKTETVGARKAEVVPVKTEEANKFLNIYHIQGGLMGSSHIGLKHQGDLIAIMSTRIIQSGEKKTIEVTRYATSLNVPGGFSRLLKTVELKYKPDSIISFSDNSLSDGSLYAKNGFSIEKELAPDYMYVVGLNRVHKFHYRVSRFKTDNNLKWLPNTTEQELANLNNLRRIWDAGKIKWVKKVTI